MTRRMIVVETLPDTARDIRITEGSITHDVTEYLHQVGVKTLSETEWTAQPARPTLYISFAAASSSAIYRTFAIELQIRERVERYSGAFVHAATWEAPMMVAVTLDSCSPAALRESARANLLKALQVQLDRFGAEWRDSHVR